MTVRNRTITAGIVAAVWRWSIGIAFGIACLLGATQASAGVLMQLTEVTSIDTRFNFLGTLNESGSSPIEANSTGSTTGSGGLVTDFAEGRVGYSDLGLHGRQTSVNALDRGFTISALLRYNDLQFSTQNGAASVSGNVGLSLDGTTELMSTLVGATDLRLSIEVFARSNGSSASGLYQRRLSNFGDQVSTNGLLSGYSGSGMLNINAPLTFSTMTLEKIELELRITARTFSVNQSVFVDGDFLNTLSLNPASLVTFTSGVSPMVNSTTGEIVNNQVVVPEPSTAILAVGALAVCLPCAKHCRRRTLRAKTARRRLPKSK